MEITRPDQGSRAREQVSIGPRPFRHGNSSNVTVMPLTRVWVSIGPRPFRHGNVSDELTIQDTDIGFQLGHVLSDMEIS